MNSVDHFEAIVSEHYEPLFRFALSLTRSESEAQDLTQQTFYVWATKGHQLRDPSRVKTWLFTTLHRAFLQTRRRQRRFIHHDLEEVSHQLPAVLPVLPPEVDPAQVLSALARVDAVYQAAVALFYLDDCSYQDIADILKVPLGTVKSRIARGIAQLREILLPDASSLSSAPQDRASSSHAAGEAPAAIEDLPSLLRGRTPSAADPHDRRPDEWGFSSTLLGELFDAA